MTDFDKKLILILLLSAALLFGLKFIPSHAEAGIAKVELQGKTVGKYNLSSESGKTVSINLPNGIAQLEFKDGAVRMLPMSVTVCPRQICFHTGWISRSGETIICIPNQLVVRIITGNNRIDAVTR
ncbi:MAG TPA: NusG domain II-containing protein [Bacillota bacterium]|jgi:hypothetical protein|nr:NusG domain II-containing protein [Bacillota bacterium]HOL09093.1 NusG domain II-containing protein [Bacillota bacterium]HPO98029.1 NusG domain II-containing protein [Bacillota bacterium]